MWARARQEMPANEDMTRFKELAMRTRGAFSLAPFNTIQQNEDYLASAADIGASAGLAHKHWLCIADTVRTHHADMIRNPELMEDPLGMNVAVEYLLTVSNNKKGRVSTVEDKLGVSKDLAPENIVIMEQLRKMSRLVHLFQLPGVFIQYPPFNRGLNVPSDVRKTLLMMILSYMPSAAAIHSEEVGHSTMDEEPCIMMQKILVCNSSDPNVLENIQAAAGDFDQSGPVWKNEMGPEGRNRRKQIPAAERWRRKDKFVRMGNILTLGYWMECLLAVINKKRLEMGLPKLANVVSVLGREPAKWMGEYSTVKALVLGPTPMTLWNLSCPHTMQSFWPHKLLEMTKQWREEGNQCLRVVSEAIGKSHSIIYSPLTETLELVRALKFIARRMKVHTKV